MPAFKDRTGQTFGRLTALREAGPHKSGNVLWSCRCECGVEKVVSGNNLQTGHTKSCGCLQRELVAETNKRIGKNHRHGHRRGKPSPTYVSWRSMLARCEKPNHKDFYLYGGAGVAVCERWHTFENFLEDMGERPSGTTLGRYLDTGSYEPGNCSWQSPVEQLAERYRKNLQLVAA